MLGNFVKTVIKRYLRRHHRYIIYSPPDIVRSIDLRADLKLILEKTDPTCFDIGANTGQTIQLLLDTFDRPYIYAFEPSREIFNKLSTKWKKKNFELYNFAFGNESAQKEFINYENSTLSSFLRIDDNENNRFRSEKILSCEIVDVKRVDDFINEKQIQHVDLLKVDTQGFDLNVLLGAKESLSNGRVTCVMIEINFVSMYRNQGKFTELHEFLNGCGFYLIDIYEKVRERNTVVWCTALFGLREYRHSAGMQKR